MCMYKFAMALELMLVLLEATMHAAWLPLGGGPAQQVGILLGSAFVLNEISPGCRRLYGSAIRWIKSRRAK